MVPVRFRETNDYAWAQRFLGGFPSFHQADYGLGPVYGTFLLGSDAADWRDITAGDLGQPPGNDVPARFRASNDWASRNGYLTGFPNFHQADYGNGVVYGTILIKRGTGEVRDVLARQLGDPPGDDIEARFRATNDWAVRNGFAAGFPNFHEADYGQGRVYGTVLLSAGRVQWRDVFASVMRLFSQFRFYSAITAEQWRQLLERHSFALTRSTTCGNISSVERSRLHEAYSRAIQHGVSTDPNANASAVVGGSQIWVNFANLFPQGDNEISQTLIHEMMHCAGYTHPNRIDPPAPNADAPGDNGKYYGTPPLRSELCIAGVQSDLADGEDVISPGRPRTCSSSAGRFTVASEVSPSLQRFSDEPEDGPDEPASRESRPVESTGHGVRSDVTAVPRESVSQLEQAVGRKALDLMERIIQLLPPGRDS